MLKIIALLAVSFAALNVAAAGGSATDGKLDACDDVLFQRDRDPLARMLDQLMSPESLLPEIDNETIIDPIAFVNNNPVQVNMMLMSESIAPTRTTASAMETATDGVNEEAEDADIVTVEPDANVEEADAAQHGRCTMGGPGCNVEQCRRDGGICFLGPSWPPFRCHKFIPQTVACARCFCIRRRRPF